MADIKANSEIVETEDKTSENINTAGIVYETIDELSARTKLPKSWWYAQTRLKGEDSVPRVKRGKYLLFIPSSIDAWLMRR